MSKQSATDYLIQEIKNDSLVQAKSTKEWNDIFKIALKMEREQIENAFENGMNAVNIHNLEQYYNETYGGQDEK